jgi:EAL domain-containing protein (putative c-di-GMP-specific phosphodiesterase class I)
MDASHLRAEERRLRQQLAELSWIRRIEDAWEHDRFRLYSQPIVRLPGGEPVQQELLLRIEEADGTIALPGPYLRAAERHGLVGRIDRWVIRGAVDHAATGLDVEVNVSAATLSDLSLFSDREFVHDLATNDRSRHVVRAVVHLARGFGLQTVAEGVEDGETLRLLGDLGVDLAQGFYLGSPTPVSAS